MTNDLNNLINHYIGAWNEADGARRRELVAATWTDDGSYLDPLMTGVGHDSIATMIGLAQEKFPGHRFELSFGPDAHNDVVRFAWTLHGADGPVATGVDFGTVTEDGRLRNVTGFLETV